MYPSIIYYRNKATEVPFQTLEYNLTYPGPKKQIIEAEWMFWKKKIMNAKLFNTRGEGIKFYQHIITKGKV